MYLCKDSNPGLVGDGWLPEISSQRYDPKRTLSAGEEERNEYMDVDSCTEPINF